MESVISDNTSLKVIDMSYVSRTRAVLEDRFLNIASVEVDREVLRGRVRPVFDVFTQHVRPRKKERLLEEVVRSIRVIETDMSQFSRKEKNYLFYLCWNGAGLNGSHVAYKFWGVEIANDKLDEPGHLEWGIMMKLGSDGSPFTSTVRHYKIAADAVAAFYREEFSSYGFLRKEDNERLSLIKRFVPVEWQGQRTRELAYKLGNLARVHEKQLEHPARPRDSREGMPGLQMIYEKTR